MLYTEQLVQITDFNSYLVKLWELKDKILIIASVRDTCGLNFSKESAALFQQLGFKAQLSGKHGHSYAGVSDRGQLVSERLSAGNETVILKQDISSEIYVYIRSSTYPRENISNIQINGSEFSINSRGLNLVVYDYNLGDVIDSVCFDTHVRDNTCSRKPEKMYASVYNTESLIRQLSQQVSALRSQVETLSQTLSVYQGKTQMMLWESYKLDGETTLDAKKRFFRRLTPADGALRKMQVISVAMLKHFDRICRENHIDYWLCFGNLLGAIRHGGFIPWDDDADVCMLREDFDRFKEVMKDNKDFVCYNFYGIHGDAGAWFNRGYKFGFREMKTTSTLDIFVYDRSRNLSPAEVRQVNQLRDNMGAESYKMFVSNATGGRRHISEWHEGYDACENLFNKYKAAYKKILGDAANGEKLVWAIDNVIERRNPTWGLNRQMPYDIVFPLTEVEFEGLTLFAPNGYDELLEILYGDIYSIPNDMQSHQHFDLSRVDDYWYQQIVDKYL